MLLYRLLAMYNFGAINLRIIIILTSQSGGEGEDYMMGPHGQSSVHSLRAVPTPMWEPTIPNTAVTHTQCITILIKVKNK